MKTITNEELNYLNEEYPVGSPVELISMEDIQAPKKGTIGEVLYIDSLETIHVKWETGSRLGVIYGIDQIEKVVNG